MATIISEVETTPTGGVSVTWTGLAQGDEGAAVDYENYADRTVQVVGTFNGASVQLVGSLDGENYAVLTDQRGDEINTSVADIKLVSEATRFVKPVVVGGGAGTSVDVIMFLRRK